MPVVRNTAIPLADYSGTVEIPASVVPDWVQKVVFSLKRCTTSSPTLWPSAGVSVELSVEFSPNGGASWSQLASFQASGGILVDKQGNEATESGLSLGIPPGANRRLRGRAVISGGVLRTRGYIEVA